MRKEKKYVLLELVMPLVRMARNQLQPSFQLSYPLIVLAAMPLIQSGPHPALLPLDRRSLGAISRA